MVSIAILGIGGYLKWTGTISQGKSYSRFSGTSRDETIDGNGTLGLGLLVLLFALGMYILYRKEKKQREKRRAEENEPYAKNRDWTPKTHKPL